MRAMLSAATVTVMLLASHAVSGGDPASPGPKGSWNASGWQVVGRVEISLQEEQDTLEVPGTDHFQLLRLEAREAPAHIERLVVYFDGGGIQRIPTRMVIPNGGTSQEISLKSRFALRKIEFWYDTAKTIEGKAGIIVHGLK